VEVEEAGIPRVGVRALHAQTEVPLLERKSRVLLLSRDVIVQVDVLLPERLGLPEAYML